MPRPNHHRKSSVSSMWKVRHPLSLGVVALLGTSCVNFDLAEQIEDTRVLAVRNEPAEIMFSPLFLLPAAQRPPLPLPTTTVQTEVYAYDPRGGQVTLTTQLCPDDGADSSCRLYDKDFDDNFARLTDPARSEVAALLEPQKTIVDVSTDSAAGRVAATFSYDVTPGVIDFFQPKDANGENAPSIFPVLPRMVVDAENAGQRDANAEVFAERAFKRLPLAMDLADPALGPDFTRNLADGLGIALCESPLPTVDEVADDAFEGPAECLAARGPNQNPPLLGFRLESSIIPTDLTQGVLEGEPDLGLTSLLRVSPGGAVAITPVWGPLASERYQVISFDIESSKVVVLNRVEDLACTWYSTRGALSSALTSLEFSDDRLGLVWNLPSDAVSGERDSLVLVVLDQRGGTTVAELNVVYR